MPLGHLSFGGNMVRLVDRNIIQKLMQCFIFEISGRMGSNICGQVSVHLNAFAIVNACTQFDFELQ